jgi:putative ABC transport system permease protein
LKEQGQRNSNVSAELLFRRPGNFGAITSTALSMEVQYGPRLMEIPGVAAVSPVGQYVKNSDQGFGLEIVEGVEYEGYLKVTGIHLREGHAIAANDEVMVDGVYAKNKKVKVGEQIEIFARKFRISGIYEPEIGARLKIPLKVMQELLHAKDRCSLIYVKCQSAEMQDLVAANINQELPGNQIIFVRDIPELYQKGFPVLRVLLKVVVGVAIIVSTLVIMLAMYTTITERTREIGILKSLGASKMFIISAIQKEALLISVLGVLLGFAATFTAKFFIVNYTALLVEIEWHWLCYATILGLLSGLLGALYPALRAARQDAVKALSYE